MKINEIDMWSNYNYNIKVNIDMANKMVASIGLDTMGLWMMNRDRWGLPCMILHVLSCIPTFSSKYGNLKSHIPSQLFVPRST